MSYNSTNMCWVLKVLRWTYFQDLHPCHLGHTLEREKLHDSFWEFAVCRMYPSDSLKALFSFQSVELQRISVVVMSIIVNTCPARWFLGSETTCTRPVSWWRASTCSFGVGSCTIERYKTAENIRTIDRIDVVDVPSHPAFCSTSPLPTIFLKVQGSTLYNLYGM